MRTLEAVGVLDHGFARLVSYMQPVRFDLKDELASSFEVGEDPKAFAERFSEVLKTAHSWSGDLEVVRDARVSYDADWRTGEDEGKDAKLLKYMFLNQHTSPFEGMVFKFEIKVPIFVARQWHRHRTWSYSEVSARYAMLPEEFYLPKAEHVGTQSKNNKQARDLQEAAGLDAMSVAFVEALQIHSLEGFRLYKQHLAAGVPRELARCFLGLNTYTRYFATVNLHNLIHFLRLRLDEHAQWEIRQYAKALLELIRPVVPLTVELFEEELGGERVT